MSLHPMIDNFIEHVWVTQTCWIWKGRLFNEYGSYKGKPAHRFSYQLFVNSLTPNMVVDYICNRHNCVNPGHLRLATYSQNMQNRRKTSKLTNTEVKGVQFDDNSRKYRVNCHREGVNYSGGTFDTKEEAKIAYRKLGEELHGEFFNDGTEDGILEKLANLKPFNFNNRNNNSLMTIFNMEFKEEEWLTKSNL